MNTTIVDTDVLIVGAGPSGGALASFLGQNGKPDLLSRINDSEIETDSVI